MSALAIANGRAFADSTLDWIVTDSAGCGAALRESGHLLHEEDAAAAAAGFAQRVRDVSEVLGAAYPPGAAPAPRTEAARAPEPPRPAAQ